MFTKKELTKIISFCANKKPHWYLTNERTELTSIEYSLISENLKKIMSGFPLNYLIGQKEFYSRNYKVSQDVLIPRDETEILVEKVIEEIEKKNCYQKSVSVLELGTGSGVIAISLVLECIKRNIKINMTATEICEKALKIARINATTYQAEICFLLGNWWNALV